MFAVQSVVQFMRIAQRMRWEEKGEKETEGRGKEENRAQLSPSQFYSLVCLLLFTVVVAIVANGAASVGCPHCVYAAFATWHFCAAAFYANEAKYCSTSNILYMPLASPLATYQLPLHVYPSAHTRTKSVGFTCIICFMCFMLFSAVRVNMPHKTASTFATDMFPK